MGDMLELADVSKSFPGPSGLVAALRDFSLALLPGEFVAVKGASGSGKTTLLMIAGAMLHPDAGKVRIQGADVYALSPEQRAKLRAEKIGFVFQQFHLVPYLTVLENVLAAGVAHPSPELPNRARLLLDRLGLAPRLHHLPGQLSSGERQRTALARALLQRPSVVLADEPTGNLDAENGAIVLDHLAAYVKDGGALLLVTHDLAAAARAQRVVELTKNG
jgi:putative ABC transport system ATP-binding protein